MEGVLVNLSPIPLTCTLRFFVSSSHFLNLKFPVKILLWKIYFWSLPSLIYFLIKLFPNFLGLYPKEIYYELLLQNFFSFRVREFFRIFGNFGRVSFASTVTKKFSCFVNFGSNFFRISLILTVFWVFTELFWGFGGSKFNFLGNLAILEWGCWYFLSFCLISWD